MPAADHQPHDVSPASRHATIDDSDRKLLMAAMR
jgi:hypothetical protein